MTTTPIDQKAHKAHNDPSLLSTLDHGRHITEQKTEILKAKHFGKIDLLQIRDLDQSFNTKYYGKKICNFGNIRNGGFYRAKQFGRDTVVANDLDIPGNTMSFRAHDLDYPVDKHSKISTYLSPHLNIIQPEVLLEKLKVPITELHVRNEASATCFDSVAS